MVERRWSTDTWAKGRSMDIQFQAGDKVRIILTGSIYEFVEYDNSGERRAAVLKQADGRRFSVLASAVSRVEDVFQVGDEVEWWTVKNYTDEDRQGLNGKRGIVVTSKHSNGAFLYHVLPVDEKIRWSSKHFPSDRGSWLTEKSNLKLVHRATDPRREGDEYEVIVEPPRGVIEFKIGDKLICRAFNASGVYPYCFSVVGAPNGYASEFVCPQETVQSHFLRVKRAGDIVIGSDTGRARVGASAAVVNHQTSGAHKPAEQYSTPTKFKAGDKVRDNTGDIGTVIRWEKNSCGNLAWLVEWADKCTSHEFERRIEFASDMPTTLRPDYFEGRNSEGRTYSDQRMLDERLERECNAEREAERSGKIKKGERSLHRFSKRILRGMVEIANAKDNYNNSHEIESVENIKLYCAEHGINFEESIN